MKKKRMVVASLVLEHDVIGTVTDWGTCFTMHLDRAGHLKYDGICISLQGENSVCCSSFFFFLFGNDVSATYQKARRWLLLAKETDNTHSSADDGNTAAPCVSIFHIK